MGSARKIEQSRDVERDEYSEQHHNPERFNSGTINWVTYGTPNCLWYCAEVTGGARIRERYDAYVKVHV